MARPSKTAPIDYAAAHDLVPGLLDRATCPAGRPVLLGLAMSGASFGFTDYLQTEPPNFGEF